MKHYRDEDGVFRTPTGVAVDSVGITEPKASDSKPKKKINFVAMSDDELEKYISSGYAG
ncbi:hypothetical protein VCRA2110O318_40061 [Vibrio crassostreae]|nr:hypothetical protein VCRA2117O328_40060 [Vibrio crassostreae]CAK2335475.1 hypothetical protein VCRA2110O318_40061 [Vibrio crassostreae]CAK2503949.1 hypothetical protein VCRA2110O319_50061 [Vibrio crassostreae]CAK2909533.1 hypothetical protein VCRA217O317_30232 [Vibrio crassostreae]